MKERNIIIDGRNLFYRTIGEGPAVMLVHGFGEDANIWKHQFHIFDGYQLILPDLPGTGRSDLLPGTSMESLADALNNILDEENVSQCIMIGHSMGGYITLAFAERYKERLAAFSLYHSTAFADSPEKIGTREKAIAFMEKNGSDAFVKTITPDMYHPDTVEHNNQLVEDHIEMARQLKKESLVAYYQAMIVRPDRTVILKDSYLPVLFIFGRKDKAVPLEDGLKQSHLPRVFSDVEIFESSGHMSMVEEPVKANRCLQNFITYVTLSTTR